MIVSRKILSKTLWLVCKNSEKTLCKSSHGYMVSVVVLIATFNNILIIALQSVLLVEETGVHGENH
jgi:hypothetical protein